MKTTRTWIFLLLIILLLPLPGLAGERYCTIAEVRDQAAKGWRGTYTAYGRTITVDVLPQVPDVEAVPILTTRLARLNPRQDPQGRWEVMLRPEDLLVVMEADREAVTETRGYTMDGVLYNHYDMNARYIKSNPQTLGDVLLMIQDIMETSGLDASLLYLDHPHSIQQLTYQDKKGNKDAEPALMGIDLYQSMKGLPVVGMHQRAYLENRRGRNVPALVMEPHPSALILSRTQFCLCLSGMLEETEQLAADVPLASFEQVVKTLEKEIKDGRLRHVFNLTFGYAIYADGGNKKPPLQADNLFYTLPVWTVDCIYVENAKQNLRDYSAPQWEGLGKDPYNVLEYKRLMVNAQTGRLADPANQSADREEFKGFLSWDDVNSRRKQP